MLETGKVVLVGKGKPDPCLSLELVIIWEHLFEGFFFGHLVDAHSLVLQEICLRQLPFSWLGVKLLLPPQQIIFVIEIVLELSLVSAIEYEKLIPIFYCIFYVVFVEVEEGLCIKSEILHEDGSCVVD